MLPAVGTGLKIADDAVRSCSYFFICINMDVYMYISVLLCWIRE
jgi:hypothetical protein